MDENTSLPTGWSKAFHDSLEAVRRTWDRSKGDYCHETGVQIHFDNDLQYAKWFPEICTFIWVQEHGFQSYINTFQLMT